MQDVMAAAVSPAAQPQSLDTLFGASAPAPSTAPLSPEDIAAHLIAMLRRSGHFRAWRVHGHTLPVAAIAAEAFSGDDSLPLAAPTDDAPTSGP
jgi:hypothetical protein